MHSGKITGKEVSADKTISFTVELDSSMDFTAGQYVTLELPDSGLVENERSRYLSIASSPDDRKSLLFATRLTGSSFKNYLESAGEGEKVNLRGPRGRFVLDGNPTMPAVFITGGIGITPIRGILQDAASRGAERDLHVFYSNTSEDDDPFRSDLGEFASRNSRIRLHRIITGGKKENRLSLAGIKKALGKDFGNSVFYLCGPPGMVSAMFKALMNAGVGMKNLRLESFSGY